MGLGGALDVGNQQSPAGTVAGGGAPVPLVDLDAPFGALALHGEAMPYVRTRWYGNPFDPSFSSLDSGGATIRFFDRSRHFAVGAGYGAVFATTHGTEPASTLSFEATGVRLEVHAELATSRRSRFDATVGGLPQAVGSLTTDTGTQGARLLHDAAAGSEIDATLRETLELQRSLSFACGARYVNQSFVYARSTVPVERDAVVLPFAELRFRL